MNSNDQLTILEVDNLTKRYGPVIAVEASRLPFIRERYWVSWVPMVRENLLRLTSLLHCKNLPPGILLTPANRDKPTSCSPPAHRYRASRAGYLRQSFSAR